MAGGAGQLLHGPIAVTVTVAGAAPGQLPGTSVNVHGPQQLPAAVNE